MSGFKKKVDVVSHATKLASDVNPFALKDIAVLIKSKMSKIQGIIQRILQSLNHYRGLNIISNSDLIVCTTTLIECFEKSVSIMANIDAENDLYTVEKMNKYIDNLQQIVDKLSIIMCGYGAKSIEDIFFISFGADLDVGFQTESELWKEKRALIMKYVKPTGYKTFHWKQSKTKTKPVVDVNINQICTNKIVEESIQIELANQYECFDIDLTGKPNYVKIYGIRVVVHNEKTQKTLIIQGLVEDIPVECLDNYYIKFRKKEILELIKSQSVGDINNRTIAGEPSPAFSEKSELVKKNGSVSVSGTHDNISCESNKREKNESDKNVIIQDELINRILETMTIKDSLINGNMDFCKKIYTILADVKYVKTNKLTATIRRFLDMDIYAQRDMIMNLLIYNQEDEVQYITYLLYDLISAKNVNGNSIDSSEQQMIYDSFPWKIKLFFKDTMKHTIKYTKDMMNKYDVNRVSLEQQIYVMKVPENVREKAMAKLKEIKGKSDDSGAKAKQYLEGLIKIPFGVYTEEPIIKKTKRLNSIFMNGLQLLEDKIKTDFISKYMGGKPKSHYSTFEILKLSENCEQMIKQTGLDMISTNILSYTVKQINQLWQIFCNDYSGNDANILELINDKKTTSIVKQEKQRLLKMNLEICKDTTLNKMIECIFGNRDVCYQKSIQELQKSKSIANEFKQDLKTVVNVLDDSIYGHENAKNQILKIIGQWMNGEQSGYCFGFEGSPGVGKTSLAKRGLANCLKNENGVARPFSFIALGGSCNGSTLEGHSYTYVNSTWGRIVDILMDSKCMNPIIYIDELDKVSKTEHGKEIIGILMHLIDTTQNSGFQDKYFSGIDIDLSKVLFIFSYNDASQIDSILLDRIHRIKFDNLSLNEKLVITRKYILPEINKKMGLENCVELSDEVVAHIIETYTLESGVRKLKEVIFDLYGEVNLELLRCDNADITNVPITITIESLDHKYLAKYDKIKEKTIHIKPEVGVINGLWANSFGRGGIIPIQAVFFPTTSFLELRLTGMQGDVMKESMNVAKSLAWSLLTETERTECLAKFEKTKEQGIHIHCPDGSTPKDGPSAGAAITSVIYSLLSGKQIPNDIAMTGEINLQGCITEIGGLEQKILGGIRAGVNTFFYPSSNERDFDKFMAKYDKQNKFKGIRFITVSKIEEVFSQLYV